MYVCVCVYYCWIGKNDREERTISHRIFFFIYISLSLCCLSAVEMGMWEKRIRLIGTPLSTITLACSSLTITKAKFTRKLSAYIYIYPKLLWD